MTALATFANLCTAIGQRVMARWENFIAPYRPQPKRDDQAPTTVGSVTCPDCGQDIPLTATVEHVAVVRLDRIAALTREDT